MIKIILTCLFSLMVLNASLAQENGQKIVDFSKYKHIQGVVFNKDAPSYGKYEGLDKKFTPLVNDLLKAEDIIFEHCSTKGTSYICSVIDDFKNYKRQYLGYLNGNGEKVLVIQLLNFKNTKKAKENFKFWRDLYLIGSGDFFRENTIEIKINLNTSAFRN